MSNSNIEQDKERKEYTSAHTTSVIGRGRCQLTVQFLCLVKLPSIGQMEEIKNIIGKYLDEKDLLFK